jgi:hypothetical protein
MMLYRDGICYGETATIGLQSRIDRREAEEAEQRELAAAQSRVVDAFAELHSLRRSEDRLRMIQRGDGPPVDYRDYAAVQERKRVMDMDLTQLCRDINIAYMRAQDAAADQDTLIDLIEKARK